jgi:hypothetical protein
MKFEYAFELVGDPEGRVMKLTEREFENFFSYQNPTKVQKALAYNVFMVEGTQFKRVPLKENEV